MPRSSSISEGFDIIIGNPPYVRQENITDPKELLTPKEYKDALLEMVRLDFPEYFALSQTRPDRFGKGRKPSGRSDLYTYFYIRSLRLLNSGGVHVFICSNSWLDVGYGSWLQEFFLRRAPLHLVIDNHARRSFTRADINTIITVAGAPAKVNENQLTRFVAFKQPFEEAVLSENLLAIEEAGAALRDESFRVLPVTAGELLREGSDAGQVSSRLQDPGQYKGDKWGGKYLRAPDIFFTILEKGKDKLVRLGEIAEVRFGIKTGANDFFYLEPLGPGSQPGLLRVCNGAGWEGEIEEEFLKPVIKSPRECRSVVIKQDDFKYRIFMCHKSKKDLKGTKALAYIKWGEKQGYSKRPTCNSRPRWWSVPNEMGNVFWGKELRERIAVFTSTKPLLADCRLYAATVTQSVQLILNSVVSILADEIKARQYGGGGGPRSLMVYEVKQQLVLSPNLAVNWGNQVKDILLRLKQRPVVSIFTECGIDPQSKIPIAEQEPNPLPDRKALDDLVFDALDLTEEERKEVYRAVCQLVWERISKARSVRRNG
ncbi:MAG: Eco57I restriction-modification methylase domain-containing protein [Dethiobacteria bacterium]